MYQFTGDPNRSRDTRARTLDVGARGAGARRGEIVLNCMASDGVRQGYDVAQLAAVRSVCNVPLVASGGAGSVAHFAAVFAQTGVDGALAASVFHDGTVNIDALKRHLQHIGIEVRL